jgi:hypothetical protein
VQTILKLLGLLFCCVLILWVADRLWVGIFRPEPAILGFGDAFNTSLKIPVEKFTAAIDAAQQTMAQKNHNGNWLYLGQNVADWISFGCTALITLIAGYYGRTTTLGNPAATANVTSGQPADPATTANPAATIAPRQPARNIVPMIGVVAALASVCTGLSSKLGADAQNDYKRADQIRALINSSRKELQEPTTTSDRAAQILSELEVIPQRNGNIDTAPEK